MQKKSKTMQKKKQRRIEFERNGFIDDQAVDKDHPEEVLDEEDGKEFHENLPGLVNDEDGTNNDATSHLQLDEEKEKQEDSKGLIASLVMKFGKNNQPQSRSSGLLPLPTVGDPNLFLVKCDPGKEAESILLLMTHFYRKESSKTHHIWIKSAFTVPKSKGFIYVEADKKVHVEKALNYVRTLKKWDIKLVPIKEMVQAITVTTTTPKVKPKQWVRLNRGGLYHTDLAQVVATSEQGKICEVKLIPRINYLELGNAQKDKKTQKQKRKRDKLRPLQKLFDPFAISQLGGDIISKSNDFKSYQGNNYKNGFLHKKVLITSLIIDDINPTLEEMEMFKCQSDNKKATVKKSEKTFKSGDRVVVIDGQMARLTGRVVSTSSTLIRMKPDDKDVQNQIFEFSINEVQKLFKQGDHVKVNSGKNKNETGIVMAVTENEVVIWTSNSKEVKVKANEISQSSEISTEKDQLGKYELHNMVKLNRGEIGVICQIENKNFKIITQSGVLVSSTIQEIEKKLWSANEVTDSQEKKVHVNDIVHVVGGVHKGRKGTIKYIWRSFIFLFSHLLKENGGIFVALAKHCTGAMGSEKQYQKLTSSGKKSDSMRRYGPIDPLCGATVQITGGPYKGSLGIVVSASELLCRVEIHDIARIINVARTLILERPKFVRPFQEHHNYDLAKFHGLDSDAPKTPCSDGGMTPVHSSAGFERTSVWGPNTPSRTLGTHDMKISQTPLFTPPQTPQTPRTPQSHRLSAHDAVESEISAMEVECTVPPPQSPTPRTPRTPLTPATP